MKPLADRAISVALACCRLLGPAAAAIYVVVDTVRRGGRVRRLLARCEGGSWRSLRRIWETRFARETINAALRLGMGEAVRRRVILDADARLPARCVLAICHTPWGRALARWNAAHRVALIEAAPRWEARADGLRIGGGVRGLRRIMRHLRSGGSVAVVIDCFAEHRAVPTCFLDEPVRVATGAARIAAAARVPLVPMVARYEHGTIRISFGAGVDARSLVVDEATRRLSLAFEAGVRADPAVWDGIIRHARQDADGDGRPAMR